MPINETAKVKMKFEADTRQARSQIKKLGTQQKKTAQETALASKKAQAAVRSQTEMMGKLAIGIAGAVVAFKALTAAARTYAKEAQLERAAQGLNVKRIQAAARGLITEYEALSFAAAQANTDFKLSQTEMEEVGKFMVVLRNQGNDLKTVYDGVTKALVEGNVRGLRQFGVILHAASGKAGAHAAIMARIREENAKAGEDIELVGDKSLQAANKMADAGHQMSLSLGRIAEHLVPVANLVERVVSGWAAILSLGKSVELGASGTIEDIAALTKKRSGLLGKIGRLNKKGASPYITAPLRLQLGDIEKELTQLRADLARAQEFGSQAVRDRIMGKPAVAPPGKGKGGGGGGGGYSIPGESERGEMTFGPRYGALSNLPPLNVPTPAGLSGGYTAPGIPEAAFDISKLEAMTAAMKEARLEADLWDQSLSIVAGTLQGAATTAFQAYVDGSKSASEALKDFVGDALSGIAAKLAAMAVSELVEGWAALANPITAPTAPLHFKAAALAGAGAIAVGAAARAWGGGGNSDTVSGGGAGAVSAGGAVGSSSVTVFVGSDFSDNPRSNAQRLSRAFARARQQEGDDSVVVYN